MIVFIRHRLTFQFAALAAWLSAGILADPLSAAYGADPAQAEVRPANRGLHERAQALTDRVRRATEKLATRTPEELRTRSEPLRKEIVELYRSLDEVYRIGNELLLRGERDGEAVQSEVETLKQALDHAVAQLRPSLGSPQGLVNAVIRRAKDQLSGLRQLDELIKQQKWSTAYAKLQDLFEAADEVGRFVAAKDAEPLYAPIQERSDQITIGYLTEQKARLIPALREEYQSLRPKLAGVREELVGVIRGLKEKQAIEWRGQALAGPDFLRQLAETWPQVDGETARASSVLAAIGPSAESDRAALQADYAAAQIQAVTMVREIIIAEAEAIPESAVAGRYTEYLQVIPLVMAALHSDPQDLLPANTALRILADRDSTLAARIAGYRAATDPLLRWRRRLAARYLKNMHEQSPPAESLARLLEKPPPLPGQEGPSGLKRTTLTSWSFKESPESVAQLWADQWRDLNVSVSRATVWWPTGANPVFISPWQKQVRGEMVFPRQTLASMAQSLGKELLASDELPPLTLEAALLLHTAIYGPYQELCGTVRGAAAENLPDRLWDLHDPRDVPGALASSLQTTFPAFPALVRLELTPTWIVHDLLVWESRLSSAASHEGSEPPGKAAQTSPSQAAGSTAPAATPEQAPSASGPAALDAAESNPPAAPRTPPTAPAKRPDSLKPAPKGGVAF